MKKIIQLVIWLLASVALNAQNLTTVTATNIQRGGVPLSSGRICFQATDSAGNNISFRVGGGGQEVNTPYCANVSAGAIVGTLQVANPLNTAPSFINYQVTVTTSTGNRVLQYSGVQFVTPTFNFDNYVPSFNLPLGASTNYLSVGTEVNSNYTDVALIPNPGNPPTGFGRVYGDLNTGLLACVTSSGANCNPASTGSAFTGGLGTSFQDVPAIAAPGNPSGVNKRLFVDQSTGQLRCIDSSGVTCLPGTTFGNFNPITFLGNITGSPAAPIASQVKTIYLADFSPTAPTTAGKIPIYDPSATNAAGGTGAYVPGDPLVQGLVAEGSTTASNPINVGGYDKAGTPAIHGVNAINSAPGGTEYGIVTRPIPSGNQNVTVTGTAATSSTQLPAALDGSGFLKVHEQGTAAISVASLPLPSGAATDAVLTGGTAKTINRGGQKGTTSTNADITHTPSGANHELLDVGLYDASGNQLGLLGSPVRTDPTGVTTQPVSGTVATTPPSNASTNVTQFGGNNVATGTGAGGVGIPRVTLSNDSSLAANQSINLSQVNGSTTATSGSGVQKVGVVGNAGGIIDFAGQNAASPASAFLIGGQFTTTPTTIASGNSSPLQMDSAGNLLVNIKAGGGTGGGPADVGASTAASETDAARQKVTAALRVLDTGQSAGSQEVAAKGDQTSGLWVNCKSGCSSASDNTATNVLNSGSGAGSSTVVSLTGDGKATFQLQAAGTLVAIATPQCSFDGGTLFPVNGVIQDPLSGQITTTATIASAQATTVYPIVCPQGASHAQFKLTTFTSGSATVLGRATVNAGPNLFYANVTTAAPSYTNNTVNIPSLNTAGALRIDGSGVTQPMNVIQFGGVAVSTGTGASGTGIPRVTVANDSKVQPWDGTNTIAVKAASTASAATDTSLVVQINPNQPSLTTPLNVNCTVGCSSAGDTVGSSGNLAALNNTVSVALAGEQSASFVLPSGNNLVGTLTPEVSFDNGTTWVSSFLRADGVSVWTASVAVSSTQVSYHVLLPGGARNARVRVSAYTSGAANSVSLIAVSQPEIEMLWHGVPGSAAPPLFSQVGGSDGTNGRILKTDSSGDLTVVFPSAQPVSAASLPLPTGAATDASVTALEVAQASTTSGQKGILAQGAVTTSAPTYTTAQTNPLSLDTSGNLRTSVTGTVTANAGTNLNTSALAVESGGNLATVASAVRAEDTASADADKGIGALAIRKASPANTSSTDGDYEYLQINAGRLWTSTTIDSALPTGTNTIGAIVVRGGQKGTTNTNADITHTPTGANHEALDVAIVDGSGAQITSFGGGTQYAEGTTQATPTGTVAMAKNPSNVVGSLLSDASGFLKVNIAAGAGGGTASTYGAVFPSTGTAIGVMSSSGSTMTNLQADNNNNLNVDCVRGCQNVNINGNTALGGPIQVAIPLAGTFGRPVRSTNDALNVYVTNSGDPCSGRKASAPISQAANAVVVPGSIGRIAVCAVMLNGSDAENVSWVEGTGSVCGTSTLAVVGGTTAANGNNLAANQGYTWGNGSGQLFNTQVPGNSLCVLQSGAGRVAGVLSYVYVQ